MQKLCEKANKKHTIIKIDAHDMHTDCNRINEVAVFK